jgi:zinc and cadmium transporter
MIWLYTFGSVLLVSLVALAGIAFVAMGRKRIGTATTYLVSLAVGALLGGAFLHLIPAALAQMPSADTVWLLVLAGFVGSFVLEKFIHAHLHGHHVEHTIEWLEEERRSTPREMTPAVGMILVGGGVHNFLDGVLIAASFMADPWLGVVTTIVVIVHEVPQEIGDFGVLLSGGLSIKRALLWNFASALVAFVGAGATLLAGAWIEGLAVVILPIAAGNFIYIAAADLVPLLHRKSGIAVSSGQVAVLVLGIVLMVGIHEWRHRFLDDQIEPDPAGQVHHHVH